MQRVTVQHSLAVSTRCLIDDRERRSGVVEEYHHTGEMQTVSTSRREQCLARLRRLRMMAMACWPRCGNGAVSTDGSSSPSTLASSRSEALRDVWMTGYLCCGGLSAAAATMERPVQAGPKPSGRWSWI
jgi:hypothetical protein